MGLHVPLSDPAGMPISVMHLVQYPPSPSPLPVPKSIRAAGDLGILALALDEIMPASGLPYPMHLAVFSPNRALVRNHPAPTCHLAG